SEKKARAVTARRVDEVDLTWSRAAGRDELLHVEVNENLDPLGICFLAEAANVGWRHAIPWGHMRVLASILAGVRNRFWREHAFSSQRRRACSPHRDPQSRTWCAMRPRRSLPRS